MAQYLGDEGLKTLTTLIKTDIKAARTYVDTTAAEKATKPKACLVTLKSSGWDSSVKTQTVTVDGITADEASCMIIAMPAVANQTAYDDAGVNPSGQAANSVTFSCDTVPTENLKVWVTWQDVKDVTPPSVGETWTINETITIGKRDSFAFDANFKSNGSQYSKIQGYGLMNPSSNGRTGFFYDTTLVYNLTLDSDTDTQWTNEAYRTVTFAEPPTGDLLTWLEANATKQ